MISISLSLLLGFLKNKVDSEERTHLARTFDIREHTKPGIGHHRKAHQEIKEFSHLPPKESESYIAALLYTPHGDRRANFGNITICLFCNNPHAT